MNVVLRILGLRALGEAVRRLPPARARMITLGVTVVANLLPLVGILIGRMNAADVFTAYWLELVIIGAFGVVRLLTARGEPRDKRGDAIARPIMFVLFYGLLVTLQAMFLVLLFTTDATIVAAYLDRIGFWSGEGPIAGGRAWLPAAVGFFLSHLIALLLDWFARGERSLCSPRLAFMQPFGRMVPMLVVMSVSGVGVAALRFLHLEVVLVALLAAVNISLESGHTAWMKRLPGAAAVMQPQAQPRPAGGSRGGRSGRPGRR